MQEELGTQRLEEGRHISGLSGAHGKTAMDRCSEDRELRRPGGRGKGSCGWRNQISLLECDGKESLKPGNTTLCFFLL